MQIKIKYFCLIALGVILGLGVNNQAFAQEEEAESMELAVEESATEGGDLKVGASVIFGTHAIGGVSAVVVYKERFGLRLGYNNMVYNYDNLELTYSGADLSNDIAIDRSLIFVAADIGLLGKGAVRLVTGAGILTGNSIKVKSSILGERRVNDVVITSSDVGFIETEVSSANSTNFYVGLGFGRAIPKSRIGFSFDIGGFYMGDLAVNMNATNLLRHNVNLQSQLEEDFNSVGAWWPAVGLRLNIRLN